MSDTLIRSTPLERETRRAFNLGLYKQRCKAKGAKTAAQRRALAEISRSTEYRWINGIGVPDMARVRRAAEKLDVTVDDLWPEVAV